MDRRRPIVQQSVSARSTRSPERRTAAQFGPAAVVASQSRGLKGAILVPIPNIQRRFEKELRPLRYSWLLLRLLSLVTLWFSNALVYGYSVIAEIEFQPLAVLLFA